MRRMIGLRSDLGLKIGAVAVDAAFSIECAAPIKCIRPSPPRSSVMLHQEIDSEKAKIGSQTSHLRINAQELNHSPKSWLLRGAVDLAKVRGSRSTSASVLAKL